jgi:phage N-6-adenine-methyltransferase
MGTVTHKQRKKTAMRTSTAPRLALEAKGSGADPRAALRQVPTLSQMIRDGQVSATKIRRASKEALAEWFAQSERLNIARDHYRLRGDRFVDFAKRLGVDRSSAFELVKLHKHRSAIRSRCLDDQDRTTARGEPYAFPGWRTALEWFERKQAYEPPNWQHGSDEWSTPRVLFDFLDRFFRFDVDVCASPSNAKCAKFITKEQDGLQQEWQSGKKHWMNAPYSQAGKWAKKADQAAKAGAIVVGLFANRSATAWYRDHLVPSALIADLHGRLTFDHLGKPVAMSSAPFSSILAIWPREAGKRLMSHCTPIAAVLLTLPE